MPKCRGATGAEGPPVRAPLPRPRTSLVPRPGSFSGERASGQGEPALPAWPEETPYHTPVFVVTHEQRDLGAARRPQPPEEPVGFPGPKAVVDRGQGADLGRQRIPLQASAQHVQDGTQHLSVVPRRPPTPWPQLMRGATTAVLGPASCRSVSATSSVPSAFTPDSLSSHASWILAHCPPFPNKVYVGYVAYVC